VSFRSDLYDVEVVVHARTAKAVLVSSDGDKKKAVWVPLSQCEVTNESLGATITLTAREWLLKDKGLI
jgi:hypothetical protein